MIRFFEGLPVNARIDPISARLIDQLQTEVPLVEQPFAEIGRRLGLAESDVIDRVQSLRTGPSAVIRQISAIFDSHQLGYHSSLVAAKVNPDKIDSAAARISEHPGVSHNYRREHSYNLWYTIAVPPDSRLGLEHSVQILHKRSGAIVSRLMPALKMYKIGVRFELSDHAESSSPQTEPSESVPKTAPTIVITEKTKQLVRALQTDLPLMPRPFDAWADSIGLTTNELLLRATDLIASGTMRRFAAVLRHREVGFTANAMGVWSIPDNDCDRFGELAAGFAAVSHCYRRPTYEDWPHSLYTMVHASSPEKAGAVLASISEATGYKDYLSLFSTREYKKTRVRYFDKDIERWESEAAAPDVAIV